MGSLITREFWIIAMVTAVLCLAAAARYLWRCFAGFHSEIKVGQARLEQRLAGIESRQAQIEESLRRMEAMLTGSARPPKPHLHLESLEALADPANLEDTTSLATAATIADPQSSSWSDPFADDGQWLPISRLAGQGYTAAQIAHRIGRPLGEVELIMSMRAA